MKLNHKIKINLLDFVKAGKFDYATLCKKKLIGWKRTTYDETSMISTDRIEKTKDAIGKIHYFYGNLKKRS